MSHLLTNDDDYEEKEFTDGKKNSLIESKFFHCCHTNNKNEKYHKNSSMRAGVFNNKNFHVAGSTTTENLPQFCLKSNM